MNATERVGAKKRKPPSEESLANEYERKRARYQTEKDDPEKVAKKVAQRKDYYQKNKEKIKSRYQKKKGEENPAALNSMRQRMRLRMRDKRQVLTSLKVEGREGLTLDMTETPPDD